MEGQALVRLANDLLGQLNVSIRVRHWTEINASIFVTLFEGLCGESLPDVIRKPRCKEDDIHNCQSVIDTLSLDFLNTSLSHITGEAIASCNRNAVANLLEVFSDLLDYINDKIGSDVSAEYDREISHDPDRMTSDLIDDVLERELGQRGHTNGQNGFRDMNGRPGNGSLELSNNGNSTEELIALGNVDSSWTSHRDSPNKTADLLQQAGLSPSGASPPIRDRKDPVSKSPKDTRQVASSLIQKTLDTERTLGLDPARQVELSNLAHSIDRLAEHRLPHEQNGASNARNSAISSRAAPSPALSTGPNSSLASSLTLPQADLGHDGSAQGARAGQFGSLGVRPRPESDRLSSSLPMDDSRTREAGRSGVHHTYTHHLYHHYNDNGTKQPLISSLPVTSTFGDGPGRSEQTRSTTGSQRIEQPIQRGTATAPTVLLDSRGELPKPRMTESAPAGKAGPLQPSKNNQSYENLENLMKDTVEFSRAAVRSSPLRERPVSANGIVDPAEVSEEESRYRNMSSDLRSALRDVTTGSVQSRKQPGQYRNRSKGHPTRQTNVIPDMDNSFSKGILSPGKKNGEKKNVSFVTSKSMSSSENSLDYIRPPRPRKSKTKTVKSASTNTTPRPLSGPSFGATVPAMSAPKQAEAGASLPINKPSTFKEYLMKYYGRDRLRSGDSDGYDSDGGVDYSDRTLSSHDGEVGTLEAEIEAYKQELMRKSKAVRFDDILDDSAPGRMGGIRRKLKKEEQKTRFKTALLDRVYEDELMEHEEELQERLKAVQAKTKEIENLYKKKVLKDPQTKYKPVKKYSASANVSPRNRNRKRTQSSVVRGRKRSYSASPAVGRQRSLRISDHEILPWLLEEFPYLHLSSETIHDMWRKSARQIEQLSKAEKEVKRKKSKAQQQIEEAEKKQQIMLNIMKKELNHNQKMRELKERRKQVVSVKANIREKRLQSARCRKYYDEYQVRMRSKMLKKRSKEEMIFKKLFKEGLDIQKDRISELRRYAREQRQQRALKQKDELDSLENYYKDQFAMIADAMAKEREDLDIREKSQSQVLDSMKKELRKKMEREIKDFQEQLYRDEDEAYFRELDADRLRHQLQMARYQTKV